MGVSISQEGWGREVGGGVGGGGWGFKREVGVWLGELAKRDWVNPVPPFVCLAPFR